MHSKKRTARRVALACGIAIAAALSVGPALAQQAVLPISIPAQPLDSALRELAKQAGINVLFSPAAVRGLTSSSIQATLTSEEAARNLLQGTDLEVFRDETGSLIVRARQEKRPKAALTDPQSVSAIEEIIVTATKRNERLQDVPLSVTALSGATLQRINAVRFEDYLTKVPGLNYLSARQGQAQLILRGIASGTLSATVGTYVDDAPYGSSTVFSLGGFYTPDFDTTDLQSIEILRGPQGTLYGANSLGGILKFVTAAPDLWDTKGRVQLSGSSVEHGGEGYAASGMINLPLVDGKLAFRASAYTRKDPGFIEDAGRGRTEINESEVKGGRASLLWQATDALSVRLTAMAQDLETDGPGQQDVGLGSFEPLYGDLQQRRATDSPADFRYRLYDATVNWHLGGADLISVSSYSTLDAPSRTDVTATYGPLLAPLLGPLGFAVDQNIAQSRFSQELRLQSAADQQVEWRGGLFYTRERSDFSQFLGAFAPASGAPVALPVSLYAVDGPGKFEEYAVFGDVTYHFTPRFDVQIGARYSHNSQTFSQLSQGLLQGGVVQFRREASDSSWTYLFNPRFKLSDDVMIYGRVASGYRPGGPNTGLPSAIATVPNSFEPDSLVNYELGMKATLFDAKVAIDLSVFHIDWSDIQLSLTTAGPGGFLYLGNGAEASSDGAEVSVVYTPVRGLTFALNTAYTDAKLSQSTPAGNPGIKGDQLPFTPHWNISADAGYEWPVANDWQAFVGASYRFVDERPGVFTLAVAPRILLPSYDTFDARAGLSNERWTLSVFAKNLGDERGIVNAGLLSSMVRFSSILQPRTYGVSVAVNF